MKIFISWSGEVSQQYAIALRDWLPSVLQFVDPYVSSEDIDKGARWNSEIAKELEASDFGVICVTPQNINAPWVNFEAGALSKSIDSARVSPLLCNMERSEVEGPLLSFQSTLTTKEEVAKLLASINRASGPHRLDDARLDKVFSVWWPELETTIAALNAGSPEVADENKRPQHEILGEVLDLVRSQQKALADPSHLVPPRYIAEVLAKSLPPYLGRGEPQMEFRAARDAYRRYQELVAILETGDMPADVQKALERLGAPLEYLGRKSRSRTWARRPADMFVVDEEQFRLDESVEGA